ncbi:hypothetical protein CEC48_22640 [Pseudomonas sp. K2I15]|nr:hypothetical protein CEC48_22640 [Pseudomonas sp. K2I15]
MARSSERISVVERFPCCPGLGNVIRARYVAGKLSALHLPLTGEEKIEISFRGNPGVRVDALDVLSEGHIRCLGLRTMPASVRCIPGARPG